MSVDGGREDWDQNHAIYSTALFLPDDDATMQMKPQIIFSDRDNKRRRAPIASAEQPICGV